MTSDDTPTSNVPPTVAEPDGASQYEIRVGERLPPRWSAWFEGLTVATAADGTTVLRGPVVDQSALHGVLQKLRDLGIPLLSLTQLPDASQAPAATAVRHDPEGI